MKEAGGEHKRSTPPGAKSSREALMALQTVYEETEALSHQGSEIMDQVHGQGQLSLSKRGLLLHLYQYGEQTIPQIAESSLIGSHRISGGCTVSILRQGPLRRRLRYYPASKSLIQLIAPRARLLIS